MGQNALTNLFWSCTQDLSVVSTAFPDAHPATLTCKRDCSRADEWVGVMTLSRLLSGFDKCT